MRPFNVKLICFISLLIGFAVFIGCGENEMLEEESTRIDAFIVSTVDGDEETQEIDVVFVDCDDNLSTDDGELNFPFDVNITIETDDTAPTFRVEGYDVHFRPNHGVYIEEDAAGDVVTSLTAGQMPDLVGTVLNPLSYAFSSSLFVPNSSETIEGMLVWTNADKVFYKDNVLANFPLLGEFRFTTAGGQSFFEEDSADFTYDMQVVLHCVETSGGEFELTTPWHPVHFLNVDRCGS